MKSEITPKTALVVVAHPDDVEYFCGGTLAKWAIEGTRVYYLVATSGDKGSDDPSVDIDELIKTRESEQLASAALLGIVDVTFLRLPDSELDFVDLKQLRGSIVQKIRETQAEVVLTHDPLVRFTKQHPDHRLIGKLTLDACFPISAVSNCYREQITILGLKTCQPMGVLLFGTDQPNYHTDISETLERKIEALRVHQSQDSAFHGGIEQRVRWKAKLVGNKNGTLAGEEFLFVNTGPTLPTS